MLKGDTAASHHAQVVCARAPVVAAQSRPARSRPTHPRFAGPATDQQRAVRFWEGYLYYARSDHEMIEDGLLEHLIAFAPHVNRCGPRATRGLRSSRNQPEPLQHRPPARSPVAVAQPTHHHLRRARRGSDSLKPSDTNYQVSHPIIANITGTAGSTATLPTEPAAEPTQLSPKEATATAAVGAQMDDLFPAVVAIVVPYPQRHWPPNKSSWSCSPTPIPEPPSRASPNATPTRTAKPARPTCSPHQPNARTSPHGNRASGTSTVSSANTALSHPNSNNRSHG